MQGEVKVKVVYEDGYEKRFTECCLSVLRRSREAKAQEGRYPGKDKKAQETAAVYMDCICDAVND